MLLRIVDICRKLLSQLRIIIFGGYREEILSRVICQEIEKLEKIKKKKLIRILDFGSGYNPIVIENIIKKLYFKYRDTKVLAYCYDFYSKEQLQLMNHNSNIKFRHIKNLSSLKKTKFNFCLILDVLHHVNLINERKIFKIIKNLNRISKFLIIKDHFQYGITSNLILRFMDFFGNFGDKVKVPSVYFTTKTYKNFVSKSKLVEIRRINNKKYYKWYWFFFNSEKLQFVSILK